MGQRIPIEPPLRGLSDDAAFAKQAPLTTRDCANMRGIDAPTGRTRLSQRSGMSKFNSTVLGGSHVQDLAVVTRDAPRIEYENLASLSSANVEWSSVSAQEGTTWWPEADFQGNIVLLDGNNQLAKYNADGVLLRSVPVLAPQGGGVVRKVQVDVDGGVYVAAYAANYLSGTVWRYVESATDPLAFEEDWVYDFSGCAPVMFAQTGNTLYVAVRHGTGYVGYELWRLDGSLTGVPTLGATQDVPGPVNALEVASSGAVWLTAPASSTRGSGPSSRGLTRMYRGEKLFTPHDLTNAEERLHFWTRADNIDGEDNGTLTDGDEVTEWVDHRFAEADATTVLDTTDRKWSKDTGSPARPGPTYQATGWGGYPCIHFDGSDTSAGASTLAGQALSTDFSISINDKASPTATQPDQKTLLPGPDAPQFFTCILVRIDATATNEGPAHLLSQWAEFTGGPGSEAISTGILTNAQFTSGLVVHSTSTIAVHVESNSGASAVALGQADGATDQIDEGSYDTTGGYALITLIQYGKDQPGLSALRVNGQLVDEFTFLADRCYSSGSRTQLGCRRRAQAQGGTAPRTEFYIDSGGPTPLAAGPVSFTGDIVEAITVYADSTNGTTPYNANIGHPAAGGTRHGFNGTDALAGQKVARYASELASDVELVEGYMAHYWGVSHLLPHTEKDAPQTATYYPGNHPFGGTGNWPVKPGETVDPTEHAEWSHDAILARYAPSSLAVTAATTGGGLGYSLATDEDGDCFAVGPKSTRTGTGTHYGATNFADETVIARKVDDIRSSIGQATASWGAVYFNRLFNVIANGGAADGDTVTISDGSTTVVFEFDNDATVTGTNTAVAIGAASTTTDLPEVQIADLVTAINASALTLTAVQNGPLACELRHDNAAANNVAITTSASGRIGVVGMQDGASSSVSWTLSNGGSAPDTAGLRMAFDDNGDIWVPQLLATEDETVTKLDGANGTTIVEYDLDAQQEATGVALPLSHPSYLGSTPVPTGPLFMYVTSTGGELATQEDNVRKVRIISETPDFAGAKTPRATRFLAVVGGVIKEFDNASTVTTKTGGALSATSPYISSVVMANKVVWADGTQYLVYDAQTDVLEPLVSTRGGTLPRNGRLLANWNGRLLIARTDDDPYVIYGSRRGEITDWDEFPVVADYLEAFSTPNSIAGRCPDIVNALIPVADDLCLIGGDHSLFRLSGDPTGGGQFDQISDTTGVAYGSSWTQDSTGARYFFGSRGGVYRTNGEAVERLTRDRIERRMASIDLSTYRMRMAYNYRDEGLHVFAVPYGVPAGTPPVAWFLDKNGAWWEDRFASLNVAPTSVVIADGDDPDDRVMLIGCGDGYVRKWDGTARDDDGHRIDSYVYIGPIGPTNTGRESKFLRPQIALASDQQGCDVEFYASDTPEIIGNLVGSARLGPGQNPRLPIRARGTAMYVRLHNGALSERWSMEQGTVGFAPAGRTRVR